MACKSQGAWFAAQVNRSLTVSNIVAFRDFLRARFPEAHAIQPGLEPAPVAGGGSCLEALDLRKGAITELVAAMPGSGAGLLLAALLQREEACREITALVDGVDGFDPWSLAPSALERVLWLRCREPATAIRATDLLLRDGNIPLVVLDLQAHSAQAVRSLPSSVWHRLRMLAEKSGACLCAFTPVRTVTCAQTRAVLGQRWQLNDLFEERPTLLASLSVQVDRQRVRVAVPAAMKATA